MRNKPNTGYEKKKKPKKMKNHYIGKLLVANPKKVSLNEKIVKFLIYLALRLVIRPKKWKDPKKNYEIIDRTYKRIMSADFIFIPSSIAFYLIMAVMPILSLIMFLYQFEAIQELLSKGHYHYTWTQTIGTTSTNVSMDFKSSELFSEHISELRKTHPTIMIDNQTSKWIIEEDLLANVLGKFIPGLKDVLNSMQSFTKGGGKHIVNAGALTATLLSLVVSTWIAAGGFSKLVFTQSYMYEHKFVGGYWMNKFKGMVMVTIFSIVLFLALAINILITKQIDSSELSDTWNSFFKTFFLVVGLFVGVFLAFIALFKFSPRYSIKIRHIIPGAMVSTIPTAGFLALFGLISSLWSYGNYGVVGTVMYIGMSSLIITYFIFVGLSANVAYYKTFVGEKVKNKWTISKK